MKIHDIMTQQVKTISPDDTIQEAAQLMARLDTGALLIEENDRLVGMITDRDITVRIVAKNMPGSTPVGNVMSTDIHYCFEDDDIQHVAENMAGIQMRRLPVLNQDKRLVGVVSLGNIARGRNQRASATVLQGVAQAH